MTKKKETSGHPHHEDEGKTIGAGATGPAAAAQGRSESETATVYNVGPARSPTPPAPAESDGETVLLGHTGAVAAPAAAAQPAELDGATMLLPQRQQAARPAAAPVAAAPAPAAGSPEGNAETVIGLQSPAAKPVVRPAAQVAADLRAAAAPVRSPDKNTAPPPAEPVRKRNTLMPPAGEAVTGEAPKPAGEKPKKKGKQPLFNPGDHVNHYELIRLLGKGGMGSVYLARDNKLGRRVAIKFLHTKNPELTKRFILEARATARCGHENIVIIYEADEFNGQPYMVLEFLQGQPLTKLITDGKPMPPARAVELMVPVVRALARAHEEGIVHRDLKPDNIFVTESGTIKVLDFGIAKLVQGDEPDAPASKEAKVDHEADTGDFGENVTDLTRHGAIMGTLAYMSPEQWRARDIDHRTDIWATGIMLFRMLAGHHPLKGLEGMELSVTGDLRQPMPSLRKAAPSVPVELADVVDKCLKKNKEERWGDAKSLLRALEPFLPGHYTRELRVDESPYAGLSSFQESDADRFFGRSNEIAAVVNRVRDQPLIAIVGPSGTGKSSFIRAGVVPALKRSGEAWESMIIRPGRNPLVALANIIAPLITSSTTVEDDLDAQSKLVQRLRDEPGYVGSLLRARARREKRSILLFIDQFEELYTMVPDLQERLAFTACLGSIADDATSPTRVVFSIRSDFLDRVPEDPRFMSEASQGLFFLTSPGKEGLREAIVQPAEMAGYHFESPGIVDDMLAHLASTQGALPLLQFTASKLWESRDPARKLLTDASYLALGGISGALASHADAVLNEMPPHTRPLVRAIFLRLVTPERTRALVSIDEQRELSQDGAEIQRAIDQLVQARLLVVQTGGGVATAELVHESLIHGWPTLHRWLDESGEDAAFIEQLRNAAKQWQAKGKDSGLLWRGEMVEEARRFQRRYRGELPKVQQDFLESVFKQALRASRVKRALTVGGLVFLSALVFASAVALVVIRNAQKEAVAQAQVAKRAEVVARNAESEAKQRLEEVQRKERERAEAARLAEEASARAQKAADQLADKNKALFDALHKAELARQNARTAQAGAERNAKAARIAREDAIKAAKELEVLLQKEQERARRLQEQLGSPVIDTLK
jgi:serine/threonine protein kinase